MKTLKNQLVYDNCRNCKSKCEHAGKDREFICRGGISCKVTYAAEDAEKAAKVFIADIKEIVAKPENLENLKNYLTFHFAEWLNKYAGTPEGMAQEMTQFAKMDI